MTVVWRIWLPILLKQPVELKSCAVQYARCRTHLAEASWPKSYLSINYVFDLIDYEGYSFNKMLFCKAFLGGTSQSAYEKLVQEYHHSDRAIDFQHIPDLDMLVWCFPNEPTLVQLQELVDVEKVVNYLPYAKLPCNNPKDISRITTKVIRYRAEQRCILRYDIEYGAKSDNVAIYAKVFESDKGEQVFLRMQQCDRLLRSLGYRTARPLHYSPEISTIWLEELVGVALAGLLP